MSDALRLGDTDGLQASLSVLEVAASLFIVLVLIKVPMLCSTHYCDSRNATMMRGAGF